MTEESIENPMQVQIEDELKNLELSKNVITKLRDLFIDKIGSFDLSLGEILRVIALEYSEDELIEKTGLKKGSIDFKKIINSILDHSDFDMIDNFDSNRFNTYRTNHPSPTETYDFHDYAGMEILNFKGFNDDENFIPLRPLTLIYGANNCGKSTILKALGSFCQTNNRRIAEGIHSDWTASGNWFDLGGAPQVLHELQKQSFEIGYTLKIIHTRYYSGIKKFIRIKPDKFQKIVFEFKMMSKYPKNTPNQNGDLKCIKIFEGDFEDHTPHKFSLVESGTENYEPGVRTYKISDLSEELINSKKSDSMEISEMILEIKNMCDSHQGVQKRIIKSMKENQRRLYSLSKELDDDEGLFSKILINRSKSPKNDKHSEYCHEILHSLMIDIILGDCQIINSIGEDKDEIDSIGLINNHIPHIKNFIESAGLEIKTIVRANQSKNAEIFKPQFSYMMEIDRKLNDLQPIENRKVDFNWSHGFTLHFLGNRMEQTLSSIYPTNKVIKPLDNSYGILKNFIHKLDYLSATRFLPKRQYHTSSAGKTTQGQGTLGESSLRLLWEQPTLLKKVNKRLQDIIGVELKMSKPKLTFKDDKTLKTHHYESSALTVQVVSSKGGTKLQLPDIGFGASQVIPILSAMAVGSSQTLIVEEPESNLHPAAQAKLMGHIIESIGDRAKEEGQTRPIIIETHSEHFLIKLLEKISDPECDIGDDQVAILYVENRDGNITVKRMKTQAGELEEYFPEEFIGGSAYSHSVI